MTSTFRHPFEAPHCGLHSSVVINLTSFTSYSTVQCHSLFLSLWLGVLHSMHTAEYVHLSLGLLEGVVFISWYNFQLNIRRQLSAFWIVSILKFSNFLTLYNTRITWMPSIVIYIQFCSFHLWDLFWLFWFGSGLLPALDFLITHKYVVCVCGLVWLGPQSQSHQTVATLKCEGFKHSLSDAILFEDNTLKLHFDIFLFSSARFL